MIIPNDREKASHFSVEKAADATKAGMASGRTNGHGDGISIQSGKYRSLFHTKSTSSSGL